MPAAENADATTRLGLRPSTWLVLCLCGVATWGGWLLTWHLADDAFITYRYLSNAMLGHGLVWNPEPFHRADGNTDFLWSMLLLSVWRVFGVEPPAIANTLALCFGLVTLWLIARAAERLPLPVPLRVWRPWLIALVLAMVVSNRAFLASLSSGIGQAIFNCGLVAWSLAAARAGSSDSRRPSHWLRLAALAAFVGLCRPEGHLVVAATALLLGWWSFGVDRRRGALAVAVAVLPVVAHVVFRRAYYGTWLPCTYHAKSVDPWPAAGMRYCATFVTEFGLYVWLLVAAAWLTRGMLGRRWFAPVLREHLGASAVVGVYVVHFAYYTFRVGGDLFEWRPYTHLLIVGPLVLLVMLRDLTGGRRPRLLFGVMLAALLCAQPIAWIKFRHDDGPVGPQLPAVLRPLVASYDRDQQWLNDRILCMRNFHMKDNYRRILGTLPSREVGAAFSYDGYPVFQAGAAGMVAWTFPHVAMIDLHGLNDLIVAHNPTRSEQQRREAKLTELGQLFDYFDQNHDGDVTADELRPWRAALTPGLPADELEQLVRNEIGGKDANGDGVLSRGEYVRVADIDVARRHAHERFPPPGYVEGLRPNLKFQGRDWRVEPRDKPLTADEIRAHERRYLDQIRGR